MRPTRHFIDPVVVSWHPEVSSPVDSRAMSGGSVKKPLASQRALSSALHRLQIVARGASQNRGRSPLGDHAASDHKGIVGKMGQESRGYWLTSRDTGGSFSLRTTCLASSFAEISLQPPSHKEAVHPPAPECDLISIQANHASKNQVITDLLIIKWQVVPGTMLSMKGSSLHSRISVGRPGLVQAVG